MLILVTGSKGTLGTHLVTQLKQNGHTVIGIDLQHEEDSGNGYYRCDVSEFRQISQILTNIKPDVVYHLAAEFGRLNGEAYYEQVWKTNVIGTRHVLECQKLLGFKLIMASSSEIYGDLPVPFLTEDLIPAKQKNDYAISKWVNELQCQNFIERYNNKIMILRFFNAYGPGEDYTMYRSVVSLFCYNALHNKPYTVYEGYHRVFMYIDDFIPTLAKACDNFQAGEIINIGGKEYRPIKDTSDIILKYLGKDDSLVVYCPQDTHNVLNKRPDISKAIKFFGHNPSTTLEEGVIKTIDWMKERYK